jgi:hypothetical protein
MDLMRGEKMRRRDAHLPRHPPPVLGHVGRIII